MEEDQVVEILEGKLSNLAIKPENSETKESSDDDRVVELKARYNSLLIKAKEKSRDGDLVGSLKYYKKAYKIHKSEKVAKRIEKLETVLQDSESDDSRTTEGYSELGDGFTLSDGICKKLYPYQKEGVLWFWKLFQEKKGGILGDDMGLGKTIQVISFLSGMFEAEHMNAALIVMPVSLLANWKKEFVKWAPEVRVSCFHGSNKKERLDALYKTQSRNGVCLTTYGLVNTCHSQFSENKYGREFTWDYVILDEGHKIKNTANKTTIAIRGIPASNHFILTGTPVQNNLREMWALFDFVCQGKLLGTSRSFKQEYENPIVRARERDATAYEKRIGQEMSSHLRELISPHFLRRTKDILQDKPKKSSDQVDGGGNPEDETVEENKVADKSEGAKVAKLTRKNDLIIWLYLSETQLQIYRDFLGLDRVKEILMTTRSPLAELNVLKKICDHPRLLSTMACNQLGLNQEQDEVDTEADNQWFAPPVEQLIQESGKMVFLIHLLQQLKQNGHRTLVFSQSRKMLDIMQKVLVDKGIKMIRVDGTITNVVERESRIEIFQSDPSYSVFLLTTQVGGVGLTLTAADRVVIFDPSWNPATDAQAVDRAYRIGQEKTVVIYRLITCGSLEEKIYRKQVFKQAITKQTTGSSNNPYRYFSRHELRELFVLDDPRSSKTQIQLEKMHSANRVSDTKLDEHLAFLYSTDIFGISDHDLLFSEEAVATQEELHAATEMVDIIQAKVRRAADIMKSESSLATEKRGVSVIPDTPNMGKKSQTKISDHVEIFKPSREDNKRFMPKKTQPSHNPDVIDITIMDNEMDEANKLGEQLSAITINEDNNSRRDIIVKEQIVLDTPENNSRSLSHSLKISETSGDEVQVDHQNIIPVLKIDTPRAEQSSETTARHGVINIATPVDFEDEIISGNLSYEVEKSENIQVGNVNDNFQENSMKDSPENGENISENSMKGTPESGISNSEDLEISIILGDSEVDMRGSRSGNRGDFEKPTPSREEDEDFSFTRIKEAKRNLGNKAFSEESDVEGDDDDGNISTNDFDQGETKTSLLDDETRRSKTKEDHKAGEKKRDGNETKVGTAEDRRQSPRVNQESGDEAMYGSADVDDDSEESNSDSSDQDSEVDDEEDRHNNSSLLEQRATVQESGYEDEKVDENQESGQDVESVEEKSPQFIISSDEEDDDVTGRKSKKKGTIVDSEEEEMGTSQDKEYGKIEDSVEDGIEEEMGTSKDIEYGMIGDSEEEDGVSEEEIGTSKDIEYGMIGDSEEEDEGSEEEIGTSKDGESGKIEGEDGHNEEEGGTVGDNEDGRITGDIEDGMEGDGDNNVIVEDSEEEDGDSEEEDGDSEEQDRITGDIEDEMEGGGTVGDSEEEDKNVEDDGDRIGSSEGGKSGDSEDDKEHEEEDEDGETETSDEYETTSEMSGNDSTESKDDTEKENNSPSDVTIVKKHDKQPDKVLQPTTESENIPEVKSTCCPRGIHVSQVAILRCPCIMSSVEQEAYKMHVNTARRYEKANDLQNALKHFVNAYKLCDSDEKLRMKLKKLYNSMKQNQRS